MAPNLRATFMRIVSLSRCRPRVDDGRAWSQAPVWGEAAAARGELNELG